MELNPLEQSVTTNYLGLFNKQGDVLVDETSEFMEISRAELAEIFGLTSDQLRPDRMSSRAKEKLSQLAGALEFVAQIFKGNRDKTKFWIKTPNLNFGGASPKELILRGRYKKVLQFILSSR